ncbi:MAG: replication factor C large subunit [Methanimicrococcus sp.]|nr:replication factor C large subunit [Methanimicrococcus sp.]
MAQITPTPTDWAEKYRPKSFKDVIGNKKPLHELRLWAEEWTKGTPEKKAVILHGAAGIGKTSSALALALEMGWEHVELNASDQRTADVIERIAGAASKTTTLFAHENMGEGKQKKSADRRLIVLDEADNLHGTYDKGGSKAISDVIDQTTQPIILIANDVYGISQGIRFKCLEIEFSRIQSRSLVPALAKIAQAEGIAANEKALAKIAENAGGDVRSAVNDLQAISVGKKTISEEDVVISGRDVKETIFKALVKVFKGKSRKEALDAVQTLDETPEDLILWIDENLPIQFPQEKNKGINTDVSNGYQILSKADLYLGRVRRRQNYRMWRYAGYMMTTGPMSVRSKDYPGFIKYSSPTRWKRVGQNRSVRNMRDNIAVKMSGQHLKSMRFSRNNLIPYYKRLMENEEYAISLTGKSEFDIDELVYLLKAKSATKKVQEIYDKAGVIIAAKGPKESAFFKTADFEKKTEKAAADKNQLTLEEVQKKQEEKKLKEKDDREKTMSQKEDKTKNQKSLSDF